VQQRWPPEPVPWSLCCGPPTPGAIGIGATVCPILYHNPNCQRHLRKH
jgi:hypothetical protein